MIEKVKIDMASEQSTEKRQEGEESTVHEPKKMVKEAWGTEETEAVIDDEEMETTAVEDAIIEESMDQLEDMERRCASRMTGRGLRLRLELMLKERWIAVAGRWREE